MHQEGILGVLGGMGPQATNTFYQRIIDRTQAESDQEHLRVLIWSDAKIPDRTAGILGTPDQAEAVYQHLLADAKLLERAGCTVLAIPCNTSHYFADRLQGAAYPSHPHDPGDGVRHSGHGENHRGHPGHRRHRPDGDLPAGAGGRRPHPGDPAGTAAKGGHVHYTMRSKRGRPAPGRSLGRLTPISARPAVTAPSWAARSCRCTAASTACPLITLTPWRFWPSRPSSAAARPCETYKEKGPRKDAAPCPTFQ